MITIRGDEQRFPAPSDGYEESVVEREMAALSIEMDIRAVMREDICRTQMSLDPQAVAEMSERGYQTLATRHR